jgi:uncharacterized Zn-finger protein
MRIHVRSHTNIRPYKCTYVNCEFRANQKSDLQKHLRVHTKERPYKCKWCDYRAAIANTLTGHLRSKHKEWDNVYNFYSLHF